MEHYIKLNNMGRFFNVPCSVADDFLKNTDGNYIKVLLCVLSWGGGKFTDERIAQLTGLDRQTVSDALIYWNDKEVISLSEVKTFVGFAVSPEYEKKQALAKAAELSSTEKSRSESVAYTPAEIASRISSDPALKNFFDNVQNVLNRTLNYTEQRGFIYIYEYYGFSASSMLLIAEYCQKLGKSSISYIKTVAGSFFEQDIVSFSEIEKHIILLEARHKYENRIAAAFGITTKLTSAQKKHIDSWDGMGIPVDMAEYAYELCVDNTGKLSFNYINKILQNWHQSGITTLEQARQQSLSHTAERKGGSKSSFDVDEIDQFQKNFLLDQNEVKT